MSAIPSWIGARAEERSSALRRAAIPALLVVLVTAAAWVILAHPREPAWDQLALLQTSWQAPHAPSPAQGFTSQLIVALARPLLPDAAAAQNSGIRLLAMVLYALSSAWFAMALLRRRVLVALFLAFVFSSQFPFLWLSSELFTAAFLMLAVAAWATGASPWLVGALLALLGLCKPDAIVVSVSLLVYWTHRRSSREEAIAMASAFFATLGTLLLPGTVVSGLAYFQSYGGSGGRSFASFSQHYAALVAPLQITGPSPNPWTDTSAYIQPHFPGARDMGDVITGHFPRYLNFVALSCVRGMFRAGWLVNWALLAVPCLAWGWRRGGFESSDRERTLLLTFVGVAPFVLFSFPHVRYLARYYPVFIVGVLLVLERVLSVDDRASRRPVLITAGACLAVSLLVNCGRLVDGLAALSANSQYWFPD